MKTEKVGYRREVKPSIFSVIFFSVFLSYITIIPSLIDHFGQSIYVMVIFFFVYLFPSYKLIKLNNSLLDSFLEFDKSLIIKISGRKDLWIIPSVIVGLGSIMLLLLTKHYLDFADKLLGNEFFLYYSRAKTIPYLIFVLILISLIVLTIIQTNFISKKLKVKKEGIISSSAVAGFMTYIAALIVAGVGIFFYFIMGGLLY